MHLTAAGPFWAFPDVVDVVGLAIAVGSVWFSWWLARRDIQKRLNAAAERASKAARDEVRRVATAVLQSGVAAAILSVELAREACRGKRWPRSGELCELARQQLARIMTQPATSSEMGDELRNASAALLDCVTRLRCQPRQGTGDVPEEVLRGLDETILTLYALEGRMTGIRPEAGHE